MVNYCRVIGCHNRSDRETDRQYYRLPEIIHREGEKTRKLSAERRRLWLANLNQDFTGKNLKNIRVCSDHFISKQKSALYDQVNPDWVPTVNMGPRHLTSPDTVSSRYQRCKDRNRKIETAQTLLSFSQAMETDDQSIDMNGQENGIEIHV